MEKAANGDAHGRSGYGTQGAIAEQRVDVFSLKHHIFNVPSSIVSWDSILWRK